MSNRAPVMARSAYLLSQTRAGLFLGRMPGFGLGILLLVIFVERVRDLAEPFAVADEAEDFFCTEKESLTFGGSAERLEEFLIDKEINTVVITGNASRHLFGCHPPIGWLKV